MTLKLKNEDRYKEKLSYIYILTYDACCRIPQTSKYIENQSIESDQY